MRTLTVTFDCGPNYPRPAKVAVVWPKDMPDPPYEALAEIVAAAALAECPGATVQDIHITHVSDTATVPRGGNHG